MQARQQIQQEYRSHPAFSEVWHAGGDAYTAVAVAKKTGTSSWVVYNIFRDHLGTITHLKNGSTIDEYSYDSWGRRRDKDNWSYTLSGEPALVADRGFTGHEYLEDFDLYNMNGRLYDPVLGRFLSPDPYIADPSFTQSYNRYSYVLNNPLKYNDPTGELPFLAWLGIAWAGNYLMGVADNHINKGMSVKDAFRNTNFVAGVNFSPSDMSRSNNYGVSHNSVDAQKAALHEEEMTAYLTAIERSQSGEGNPARGGENWLNKTWNSDFYRCYFPDVIYVNISGVLTYLGGGGADVGLALPLRGKTSGTVYIYSTLKGKAGLHGGVSVNWGRSYYLGSANLFDFDATFGGKSSGIEGDYLIGASISASEYDRHGNSLLSIDFGVGPGIGGSVNVGAITYIYPWFRIWH